jgi:hypothetical protein
MIRHDAFDDGGTPSWRARHASQRYSPARWVLAWFALTVLLPAWLLFPGILVLVVWDQMGVPGILMLAGVAGFGAWLNWVGTRGAP